MVVGVWLGQGYVASADPPYEDCSQARADGRSSIPYTDPAYNPDLDLDGDGLACEPSKAHRSRR
ncbi:excalibur calcium-binding domain-containing protein [Candidatus Mycobacterium wuenschmannii]|uniref:Excalibur calcium-binding domain-containing protein n=1 Tax=Candidatus Mycobacterium wuenschmannii TaxID=3027808 RepID=A0ABY8W4V7_9MYCO|nr:excalibur calcium-binding domain-containing protein [Candidatus Mycobacterium wuenschmannii]WIM90087.1 excalibur calcium-binding domain-containing protein [Candidatus Mycobacterium wuenschmannii]